MSDMYNTRRRERYDDEECKPTKPASVAPASLNPQSAWDTEGRRKLLRQVTNLGKKMVYNDLKYIVCAIVICGALLTLVWRQQAKFEERIRAERAATVKELKKVHDGLQRASEISEDDRRAVTAAFTPVATFQDFVGWTPDGPYYGWRIVRMFDDLEVIHLRWDRMLYEYHHYPVKGVARDPDEVDQYVHLGHTLYACAKRAPSTSDWVELRIHLSQFVVAAQGGTASLETLKEFNHATVTERYEAEHVIGVIDGLWPDRAFYLHLDNTTYALAKEMKTLDVWKLKEAKRIAEEAEPPKEFVREPVTDERAADFTDTKPHSLAELRQYDGEKIAWAIERRFDGSFIRCVCVRHLPYAYGKRVPVSLFLSAEDFALMKNKKTFDVQVLEEAYRNR